MQFILIGVSAFTVRRRCSRRWSTPSASSASGKQDELKRRLSVAGSGRAGRAVTALLRKGKLSGEPGHRRAAARRSRCRRGWRTCSSRPSWSITVAQLLSLLRRRRVPAGCVLGLLGDGGSRCRWCWRCCSALLPFVFVLFMRSRRSTQAVRAAAGRAGDDGALAARRPRAVERVQDGRDRDAVARHHRVRARLRGAGAGHAVRAGGGAT